ncbi:sigma factor-like helix-turn-helix DNA-binding protein [Micromonospora sp. KC721]|uniref:sigma factor-like helix-turn-helix DNA-binding protein n=1 Tax=Micromonospora sp. KC721 TaxID=2530380 RepID=UPI00104FF657|nr:sigma factor-like helix-turn-helix DNA-binding protein [Micromonospora sp. KC721]TDB80165.1 sigma-70 family RNA polymerase sigma factor [Micromonospora sp. KC721]
MPDTQEATTPQDRLQRARKINALIDDHQMTIAELSRERREIFEGLLHDGMTQLQIAEALGMSRSRVSQLLSAGVRPERALLGSGRLTVAIGGKREMGRADGKPLAVLSAEALAAYDRIAELARSVGLSADHEIVPPPGMVNLNRTNLIVLTSPRLLPFVGQVLEADEHLGFAVDEQGWYLIDKNADKEYRSPSDSGEPMDFAYIGRLPRPDGKGTFLYLAGIHGPGTAGAAHYLEGHLAEIYREVRGRRWSALITCHFDPGSRQIISSELLTPIFRHEGA